MASLAHPFPQQRAPRRCRCPGRGISLISHDLLLVGPVPIARPLQREQMLGAPVAYQGFADGLFAGFDVRRAPLGQHGGIPFAGHSGVHDRHPGQSVQIEGRGADSSVSVICVCAGWAGWPVAPDHYDAESRPAPRRQRPTECKYGIHWHLCTSVQRPGTFFIWRASTQQGFTAYRSSMWYSGIQYTPVDSVAAVVNRHFISHSAGCCRCWVKGQKDPHEIVS